MKDLEWLVLNVLSGDGNVLATFGEWSNHGIDKWSKRALKRVKGNSGELMWMRDGCITWLSCKEEEISDDIKIKWKDGTTTKMINGEIVTNRSITN